MNTYNCDGEHCGRALPNSVERFSVAIEIKRYHQGAEYVHTLYPGTVMLDLCADCFHHFERVMSFKRRPPLQHVKTHESAIVWPDTEVSVCVVCAAPTSGRFKAGNGTTIWVCHKHEKEGIKLVWQNTPNAGACAICLGPATSYMGTPDGGGIAACQAHYEAVKQFVIQQSEHYENHACFDCGAQATNYVKTRDAAGEVTAETGRVYLCARHYRDQALTPEQHAAFATRVAKQFGVIVE